MAALSASMAVLHPEALGAEKNFRAYFIGNSLTRGLSPERMKPFFEQHSMEFEYGTQLGAGVMLNEHLSKIAVYTGEPFRINTDVQTRAFGHYDEALKSDKFNALIIQPYMWWVESRPHFRFKEKILEGDRQAAGAFIKYARGENLEANVATTNFFIYETWPRIEGIQRRNHNPDENGIANFAEFYNAPYTYDVLWGQAVHTVPGKEHSRLLIKGLNKDLPDLETPVRLIPVGEVLAELD